MAFCPSPSGMSGGPDTPRDRWGPGPGRGRLVVSSQDRVPVVGMAEVVGGAGAVGPVAARRVPTVVADPPQTDSAGTGPRSPKHHAGTRKSPRLQIPPIG